MQQVRVIVATSEQIEQEIAQELFKGWSLLGPVQYGGVRPYLSGGGINLYVATLVREIP